MTSFGKLTTPLPIPRLGCLKRISAIVVLPAAGLFTQTPLPPTLRRLPGKLAILGAMGVRMREPASSSYVFAGALAAETEAAWPSLQAPRVSQSALAAC